MFAGRFSITAVCVWQSLAFRRLSAPHISDSFLIKRAECARQSTKLWGLFKSSLSRFFCTLCVLSVRNPVHLSLTQTEDAWQLCHYTHTYNVLAYLYHIFFPHTLSIRTACPYIFLPILFLSFSRKSERSIYQLHLRIFCCLPLK